MARSSKAGGAGPRGPARALPFLIGRFFKDGGMFLAASVSYYALLSLIPLMSVVIFLFAYFLGRSPDVQAAMTGYVKTIYPMLGETLTHEIARVVENSRLGWISFAVFLWLSSLVFSSVEFSINTIFKTSRRRHFFMTTAVSVGMVMLSGVFMVGSFWIAYIPKFIQGHPGVMLKSPTAVFLTKSVLLQILPVVLVTVSFSVLFKVLPNRKIPVGLAAKGGLAAALMWEASKYGFALYVGRIASLGSVYGSLTAIIVFLLWIFFSANILLIVAEAMYLVCEGEIT